MLSEVGAALRSLATRGKVSATATLLTNRAVLQLRGLAKEVRNGIELLQPYGMSSRPLAGGDVLLIQIGGSRDHCVAVHADDPSLRIADLQPGEFGFRDQNGQQVVFRVDRIEVTTPLKLVASVTGECDITSAAKIRLVAPEIDIHATTKLKFDCDGNGTDIQPTTRTDYVIGSTSTSVALAPPEIP